MTIKKSYIVPESAIEQVLEPVFPIMDFTGAGGVTDPDDDPTIHLGAPGRKPF